MNCRFQLLVRCQTRMILNAVGRLAVLSAHLWAVFYSLWHKNSSGYSVSGSPCAASILHKSLRLSQQTFFIFGQEIWKYEKSQAGTRLLCLLSLPYLQFLPLLILQFEGGKMAVSAKKNRKRPRLNLHSWCDPSWPWLHKEYKLTFPGWCCKLWLALTNHKEGAHTWQINTWIIFIGICSPIHRRP